jgi:hypothetical protein
LLEQHEVPLLIVNAEHDIGCAKGEKHSDPLASFLEPHEEKDARHLHLFFEDVCVH